MMHTIAMAEMVLAWYGVKPKWAKAFVEWCESGGSLDRFITAAMIIDGSLDA